MGEFSCSDDHGQSTMTAMSSNCREPIEIENKRKTSESTIFEDLITARKLDSSPEEINMAPPSLSACGECRNRDMKRRRSRRRVAGLKYSILLVLLLMTMSSNNSRQNRAIRLLGAQGANDDGANDDGANDDGSNAAANEDDDLYQWDENLSFDDVSVMPISCVNYNNGYVILFQFFEKSTSYQCHFKNLGTFIVSIAHYMRAYFNYQALLNGRNFNLPGDAGFLNCVMVQETAYSEYPLYAKIGCMERQSFRSTKLQLHVYYDPQCSIPYDDGYSSQKHASSGYEINGYYFSSKVSFRPPLYTCQNCQPSSISDSFSRQNSYWYDDDYISREGKRRDDDYVDDGGGAGNGDDVVGDDAVVDDQNNGQDDYFNANDDINGDDRNGNANDDEDEDDVEEEEEEEEDDVEDDNGDDVEDDGGGGGDDGADDDDGGDDGNDGDDGNNGDDWRNGDGNKHNGQGYWDDDDDFYTLDDDDNSGGRRSLMGSMKTFTAVPGALETFEREFWNEFEQTSRRLEDNAYDIGDWNMCRQIYKYGLWCDEECREVNYLRTNEWSSSDIFLLVIMCVFMTAMMLLVFVKQVKAYEKASVYGEELDVSHPGLPPTAMAMFFVLIMTLILGLAALKFVNQTLVFAVITCILLFIYMLKLTLFETRSTATLLTGRGGASVGDNYSLGSYGFD